MRTFKVFLGNGDPDIIECDEIKEHLNRLDAWCDGQNIATYWNPSGIRDITGQGGNKKVEGNESQFKD